MCDRDVAGVVALRALEGDRGDEGGCLVAVLVGRNLAPGVRAASVRAGDSVYEGDVDAARQDEMSGYVLEVLELVVGGRTSALGKE